jgi:hypothetical protein
MPNLYNVLYDAPILEAKKMPKGAEKLAQSLVSSGLIRIDAGDRMNFARLSLPYENVELTFTRREMENPQLFQHSKARLIDKLTQTMNSAQAEDKAITELQGIRAKLKRIAELPQDYEIQIARLLVQSAHPSVISLAIRENVQIYVSFSYSVGDMMDVWNWQSVGSNSGLQATSRDDYKVYVSAGGNPFIDPEDSKYPADGSSAISRLMVIAAQELAHYSDIIRNFNGQAVSRHSADLGGRQAKPKVAGARLDDIANVESLRSRLIALGLTKAVELDRELLLIREYKRRDLQSFGTRVSRALFHHAFFSACKKQGMGFALYIGKDEYPALRLRNMLDDMLFNLAPKADVYRRSSAREEEAIACIEALARVPQQVVKWGHVVTRATMTGLYDIYYNQVIPTVNEYLN